MRRPLLIGEAPDGDGVILAGSSHSGRRMDQLLAGVGFDALTLLSRSRRTEDEWPADVARARAEALYHNGVFAWREVVLLGRRVARAFGRGLSPHFDRLHPAPYFSSVYPTLPDGDGGWARAMVWLVPHPSGRSRWWNAQSHRSQAAAFFGQILGRTPFPDLPEMPTPKPPGDWEFLAGTESWPRFSA